MAGMGDEITDLAIIPIDPLDENGFNMRFSGRYRGVLAASLAYVSPELAKDMPVLEQFARRTLLEFAEANWPPVPEPPKE